MHKHICLYLQDERFKLNNDHYTTIYSYMPYGIRSTSYLYACDFKQAGSI